MTALPASKPPDSQAGQRPSLPIGPAKRPMLHAPALSIRREMAPAVLTLERRHLVEDRPRPERVLRQMRSRALAVIFLCFGMMGGWLSYARLDSAVVAPGILENEGTTRLIQHLEGGIVREIFVRNGDFVEEGALLARLDATRNQASAALFESQLFGSRLREARHEAEIALAPSLIFGPDLQQAMAARPEFAALGQREQRRFALLQGELAQTRALLQNQIAQAQEEIRIHNLRRDIAAREMALVASDLADQKNLLSRGLTAQARVTQLEQQSLTLEERMAEAEIAIARTEQQISGLELQITQLEQDYRARAAAEQEQTQREIRGLERDAALADDSLDRVELRAPVSGTVQESMLGTLGAVIRGGETIMRIAPEAGDLLIIARVAPDDIDALTPGAVARVSFPAFTAANLKPARAEVLALSRDRQTDPLTGRDFYEARLRLDRASLPADLAARLVAGMATTTVIPTGERSAINYLIGPLRMRFETAMRED